MHHLIEALERRSHARWQRLISCELWAGGRRVPGVLRDISSQGLFVETRAALPQGSEAIVAFDTPEGTRFVLEVSVPRTRAVARSLDAHCAGGVGLRIENPPEAYRHWATGRAQGR